MNTSQQRVILRFCVHWLITAWAVVFLSISAEISALNRFKSKSGHSERVPPEIRNLRLNNNEKSWSNIIEWFRCAIPPLWRKEKSGTSMEKNWDTFIGTGDYPGSNYMSSVLNTIFAAKEVVPGIENGLRPEGSDAFWGSKPGDSERSGHLGRDWEGIRTPKSYLK